jgi:hypothetical protein
MFKNYQSAMKQLNDLIIVKDPEEEDDGFDSFGEDDE